MFTLIFTYLFGGALGAQKRFPSDWCFLDSRV
jgi:hypothetical protein